ncbi:MAG: cytochrome c [Oligoflexia bacterium]|nr:cytochrome c [Oligoflexia bacterium]
MSSARRIPARALLIATLLLASACQSRDSAPTSPTETAPSPSGATALAQRGRTVYQTRCTACHNANPALPGAIGPEVRGASRVLLEARILHAAYPAGYQPKRTTRAMQALPELKEELDALHAYLNP